MKTLESLNSSKVLQRKVAQKQGVRCAALINYQVRVGIFASRSSILLLARFA